MDFQKEHERLFIKENTDTLVKPEPVEDTNDSELITCTPCIEETLSIQEDDLAANFKKIENDPMNVVECAVCFKKIKESSMKQHSRTHAGLRPFQCDICEARFTRRSDVFRHHKVLHKKVRPFPCKLCKRRFSNRYMLNVHIQNHQSSSIFECNICEHKFGKKEYYDHHMKFIHPSSNSPTTVPLNKLTNRYVKSRNKHSRVLTVCSDSLPNNRNQANVMMGESKGSPRLAVKTEALEEEADVVGSSLPPIYSEEMIVQVLEASVRQSRDILSSLVRSSGLAGPLSTANMEVSATTTDRALTKHCKVQLVTKDPLEVLSEASTTLLVNIVKDAVDGELHTITITS